MLVLTYPCNAIYSLSTKYIYHRIKLTQYSGETKQTCRHKNKTILTPPHKNGYLKWCTGQQCPKLRTEGKKTCLKNMQCVVDCAIE
jgi:hypothetical protein